MGALVDKHWKWFFAGAVSATVPLALVLLNAVVIRASPQSALAGYPDRLTEIEENRPAPAGAAAQEDKRERYDKWKAEHEAAAVAKKGLLKVLGAAERSGGDDMLSAGGGSKVDQDFDSLLGGDAASKVPKRSHSKRPEPAADEGEDSLSPAPTRSWFPESFLFAPLVVTDAAGRASLEVPVPDRLTSWRILALAHSREGALAGAVTSFLGTLPAYVDPVVPKSLIAGDEVRLPIQVVNTTVNNVSLPLEVDAVGAELKAPSGKVSVGAGSSTVEYAELKTLKPGEVSLHATLGGADAIARVIPVVPSGRAVTELRGGTLAAERTLTIASAPELLPDSTRARLLVFPSALGLLRSELTAASSRGGIAADGYALLLAGKASALLEALGDAPNPEALRNLALVAQQRVLRDAHTPDTGTAALLGEAALAHPENPVLARLGERLVAEVAQSQRPDGTFEGGAGWTLQRLLVTTAQCVQMVRADQRDDRSKQRAANVALKAQAAFERNLARIEDGYTAAAILASGAAPASAQPKLRELVRKAITTQLDGSRVLVPMSYVVRFDGEHPSTLEATALAALALDGDPEAPWRADLGSALLGGYSPASGWGDGETNLVALRAVLALFQAPLPSSVTITLAMDGHPVAHGDLAGAKLKDVLALDAAIADASGSHTWTVSSQPAVPGLGFSLAVTGYVPWKPEPMNRGLELAIKQPATARVGEPLEVEVTAAAPANQPVRIRHALPAGVEAVTRSLELLVQQGVLSAYSTEPGAVILEVPPRPANTPFRASYAVVPTLAGTLHAGPSVIEALGRAGERFHLPPAVLAVR